MVFINGNVTLAICSLPFGGAKNSGHGRELVGPGHPRVLQHQGSLDRLVSPHPIGSLRAVALDAPDIDLLATFYEQLAGGRRVPDDDEDEIEDDWITMGLR